MSDHPHCDTLHCETLALDQQGPVLHLTLNRPEARNAMSLAMVAELASVFHQIEDDASVRAVVIRGAGGHFCAGGDIRDMASARGQTLAEGEQDPLYRQNRAFGEMIEQVNKSSKVVIAVLEGAVMGGGFGLACVSDVAIAGDSAHFALPETSLGVVPAQIAPFVLERIGLTQTRRLALLGLHFKGDEACRLGVVHLVGKNEAEVNELLAEALDRVRHCAPHATSATKALLHRAGHEPMGPLLDSAAHQFAAAIRSDEGAEGTLAFLQKRPPRWATQDPSDPS